MKIWISGHPFLTLNLHCKPVNWLYCVQFLSNVIFGKTVWDIPQTPTKAVAFAIKILLQVNFTNQISPHSIALIKHIGWSSSQNRPSDFSEVRYVLEPGEYVWFLQADADLTNTVFKSLYKNQSFFFPPSSNLTNVTQFATQIPPKPLCRNAVDMVRNYCETCSS